MYNPNTSHRRMIPLYWKTHNPCNPSEQLQRIRWRERSPTLVDPGWSPRDPFLLKKMFAKMVKSWKTMGMLSHGSRVTMRDCWLQQQAQTGRCRGGFGRRCQPVGCVITEHTELHHRHYTELDIYIIIQGSYMEWMWRERCAFGT